MDELDPEHRIGTTVAEKYRIRALLGRGSMGFVYDVEDIESGRLGALKVLLPEVTQNPEIAARLVREGKAMNLLSHRNIVALLDAGTLSDGTPFIITELAGGVSLRSVMDAGLIDQRRALAIVRQILDALEHAHGHGIIHRDVKPDNVIVSVDELTREDTVKVLDFGVAKLVDDTRKLLGEAKLTQVGFELFGSPHYVAPEVVVGGAVDARVGRTLAVRYWTMGKQQPCTQLVFEGQDAPSGLSTHSVTPGSHSVPVPAQKIAQASPESPPLFWSPS